jgi:mannose/fructose-specific phosphotransferase system component IIA
MRNFRLILTSHSFLAAGLRASAEMIAGRLADVAVVELEAGASLEDYDARLRAAIGQDRPALVLCDLRGGTPHNRVGALNMGSQPLVCLTGVNLAMVLEAALAQGDLTPDLVARVVRAGRTGITESARRSKS